jgi:DNA-binding CsgD family transcriptional regulator
MGSYRLRGAETFPARDGSRLAMWGNVAGQCGADALLKDIMTERVPLTAYLQRVFEAQSIEDIWALHVDRMASYGFTRLLYVFTRFRTANSFGKVDDILVLSNHTKNYLDGYFYSGLCLQAPMLKWAAGNDGAQSWRLIAEKALGPLTPVERKIMEFNQRHGVVAGSTIGFRDISVRAKGGIGLAVAPGRTQDDADAIWAEYGDEILTANNVTHLRITVMPYASSRRALTPRQRETLEWVGEGKTTQDIATIMGLTSATVEKHLRLAREALDVDTTAQAVLKASFQNQIFIQPQTV